MCFPLYTFFTWIQKYDWLNNHSIDIFTLTSWLSAFVLSFPIYLFSTSFLSRIELRNLFFVWAHWFFFAHFVFIDNEKSIQSLYKFCLHILLSGFFVSSKVDVDKYLFLSGPIMRTLPASILFYYE